MAEPISEHARHLLLDHGKILGEDLTERMGRFGLIVENAYGNWDLSDRDMNAIRTASSMLGEALDLLRLILPMAKGYAHEHPVGGNQDKVNRAVEFLLPSPATATAEPQEKEK